MAVSRLDFQNARFTEEIPGFVGRLVLYSEHHRMFFAAMRAFLNLRHGYSIKWTLIPPSPSVFQLA
jgi:hypothetical protein